ncbi:MAG: IS3 family transposase [Fusobacteriaceae bacterium]
MDIFSFIYGFYTNEIKGWYNYHRIQKKLGYLSPADYEKQSA